MQTPLRAAALAAALATAAASPLAPSALGGVRTPPPPLPRSARLTAAGPQVLICTGANATGTCLYGAYALGACHQLAAPLHGAARTFALDEGAFACLPRAVDCDALCTSPTGCSFGAVDSRYEHRYDLAAVGWDALLASFVCRASPAPRR